MKKMRLMAGCIAVAAVLASCSVTRPLSIASSGAPIGSKEGVSKTIVWCGIQFNKEFGIADAAKNGGIKGAVGIADLKFTNYVLYKKKEIIVHGN